MLRHGGWKFYVRKGIMVVHLINLLLPCTYFDKQTNYYLYSSLSVNNIIRKLQQKESINYNFNWIIITWIISTTITMTINTLKTYIYKANFLNYTKKIENFPLKYNSYNSSLIPIN